VSTPRPRGADPGARVRRGSAPRAGGRRRRPARSSEQRSRLCRPTARSPALQAPAGVPPQREGSTGPRPATAASPPAGPDRRLSRSRAGCPPHGQERPARARAPRTGKSAPHGQERPARARAPRTGKSAPHGQERPARARAPRTGKSAERGDWIAAGDHHCRERRLADDHRVDELDRDVMSVKGPLEHEAPQRRSATKAASEIESGSSSVNRLGATSRPSTDRPPDSPSGADPMPPPTRLDPRTGCSGTPGAIPDSPHLGRCHLALWSAQVVPRAR